MKKIIILLAALAIAAPAFAGPGIDLAANHICPGAAGAASDGGVVDCTVLLAQSPQGYAEVFATFKAAEAISDLSNLDGQVDVAIVGTWNTNGQFWDTSAGGCLDQAGAAPAANTFIGAKPGANCGTAVSIRQAFGASALTTVINNPSSQSMFFTVYNSSPISITTAQRIFGFQIRYDPAYSPEGGVFTCGDCHTPVCWTLVKATPGSLNASPTTTLTTSTGEAPGTGLQAWYNAGCPAVPTKAKTWGQLKSLYR